jgi:hypothetical protein
MLDLRIVSDRLRRPNKAQRRRPVKSILDFRYGMSTYPHLEGEGLSLLSDKSDNATMG